MTTRVLSAALIALTAWPLMAAAQSASPSTSSGELRQEMTRKRYIVLPKPSAEDVKADVNRAVDELQAPQRQEEAIRSTVAPPRRPDLDRSVVEGIQAQQLNRALRR